MPALRAAGAEIHLFRMKIDPAKSDWMCHLRVTGIDDLYNEYCRQVVIHPNGRLQTKPWGQKEIRCAGFERNLADVWRSGEVRLTTSAQVWARSPMSGGLSL
jgi:hypothetical protein